MEGNRIRLKKITSYTFLTTIRKAIGDFDMWERINRFYPAWLELIPVVMFGFVFFYTVTHYGALPTRMPTHFGPSGQPDGWSTKGFGSVYLPLVIGILVWLFMFICNYFLIIRPDDPGKYMSMSKLEKEKKGPKQLEELRTVAARSMMVMNLTVAAMMAAIEYGAINSALGLQKGLGLGIWVFVIALIAETIWIVVKIGAVNFTPWPGRR